MESDRVNKKGLFLLLILGVFSFVAIKNVKSPESKSSEMENPLIGDTISEVIAKETSSNEDIYYALTNEGFEEVQPEFVLEQDIDGDVLAEESSTSDACKNADIIFQAASACNITDSASVNYSKEGLFERSGTQVRVDATVKLTKIVAPIYLLSGAYETENSNYKLDNDNWVYNAAGEIYTDKDIYVNAPPGELRDEIESEVIEGSSELLPYSTVYSVGFEENSTVTESGEAVIEQRATTNCPECQKQANDNPDKSNNSSEYLENSLMRYPGELVLEAEKEEELSFANMCEKMESIYVSQAGSSVCDRNWLSDIWTKVTNIFSSSQWDSCRDCQEDEYGNKVCENKCINSEDIFVKMTPIFTETNSYVQRRNKIVKSPEESASYTSKYFITNCEAVVDGITVDVKCAWDLGYLLDEREYAEFDDLGESDTPSEDIYIKYLQLESSSRTDPLVEL